MYMSDKEIKKSMDQADNKNKQIKILAQLNGVSTSDMKEKTDQIYKQPVEEPKKEIIKRKWLCSEHKAELDEFVKTGLTTGQIGAKIRELGYEIKYNTLYMYIATHYEKPQPTTKTKDIKTDIPIGGSVLDVKPVKTEDPIKPSYYNDSKISPWDVIDDWELGFNLGSAMKYIKRAGKKDGNSRLQDLNKIKAYVEREISKEVVRNE